MNLFLWGALPYIAFTFLIVGTLVRFFYFERNWTTKSSEFLEKKQLRIANPLFHFGLLCVIGGHVVGVLVPKAWTAAMGINDHMYHEGALYMGAVAGIIFIVGFLLLMKRRFTVPAMKVNTSGLDKWLYLFLTLAIFSGMAGTAMSLIIRLELAAPGSQYLHGNSQLFNVLVVGHAVLIIFFLVMPALIGGFGNYLLPLMIGATDTAFPRINNIAF